MCWVLLSGENFPRNISIAYHSTTKIRIDLKPGRRFKFVCRQKVLKKKYQLGPWKDRGGPLFTKGPLKSDPHLEVYLDVHEVPQ